VVSVLDRKLRRDLIGARATLLAILLVIVVGIACFVGMVSSYMNLEQSRREYYARCRMADFSVELKKAPLAEIDPIATLPGVAEIRPRIAFDATVDLEHVVQPLSGLVLSLPDAPAPVINNVILSRGSYFTDERLEQVIVNESFARARHIHPGQTIHLVLNNRRQSLLVVGTGISSEFVYLMAPGSVAPDPKRYGVFYIKRSFAEDALDFDGACNQIVGLLTPDARPDPDLVLDEIERRLEPFGVFATTPRSRQPSHRALSDELTGLRVSAVVIPIIFLSVAALILNILMTRLADQQRVTVGTLKALGYSDRAIRWHYLKFGMMVGILGGVGGSALGYLMAAGMIALYHVFFEFPRLENNGRPSAYAIAIVIGIVFALVGTLRGVRAIVRLSPADAMRPKPPAAAGAIALERWRRLWRSLDFRWQMVARTVWRNKGRTIAGMVAAATGTAILLLTISLYDSMIEVVRFQFDEVLVSDFDMTFREALDRGALLEARRLPGVDHAEPLFVVACDLRNGHRTRRSSITGVTRNARLTIPRQAGGEPIEIPSRGLVMSRRMARILDLRPGNAVTIVPVKGLREPIETTVARITDSYFGMVTYADYRYLNRIVGEAAAVSTVQLDVQPGRERRTNLYRAVKSLPVVAAVNDINQSKANIERLYLESSKASISILILFGGVIFFGSILTTSLVSIAERRRDVATFIVMGYEKTQVGGIFLRESMIVNSLGALLGLPVGLLLAIVTNHIYDTELYRLPLVVNARQFIIALLLAIAFTLLAHLLVQRAVNRLDWLDALNARE
jgi:putative ABC transport system permease protein